MPTTLSTDEMKAKVRSHFEDFVNNRRAEVIRTNMTPDFYDHDGPGGEPTDTSGDEEMMRRMYTNMPDLRLTIEDLIAEDDKVVCKNHWRWTDAQTGKKMGFHGFVLWRFEGDKIAERWPQSPSPPKTPRGSRWRPSQERCLHPDAQLSRGTNCACVVRGGAGRRYKCGTRRTRHGRQTL